MLNVALIDYGTGNLHSLSTALHAEGAQVTIERDVDAAARADAVVLPGVGAFGAAAPMLAGGTGLRSALAAGLPCLGICLGMQLLYESSDEGDGAGLGVLRGRSRRIRARRIPHMGWNDIGVQRDDVLFEGIGDDFVAYYANSYVVEPADDTLVIARTRYDDELFPAAVRAQNVWGVQFHPEKSGRMGRRLLRNFISAAVRT